MKCKIFFRFIFAAIVFLVSVEILIRIYAFYISYKTINESETNYSILTLGESTTAAIGKTGDDWPSQLEVLLNNNELKSNVFNKALSATTSNQILYNFPEYIEKYKPNLVITMMGINDYSKFWPKNLIITDPNKISLNIKTVKLILTAYQSYKTWKYENSDQVNPSIESNNLDYPDIDISVKKLDKLNYDSDEFKNIFNQIETFVKNKNNTDKAKLFAYFGYKLDDSPFNKNLDLRKKFIFFYYAAKHDSRVSDSANLALHLAISTNQNQFCKEIISFAKRDNIKMNDTFLLRSAACLEKEIEFINTLFREAGDLYQYRPNSDGPTIMNYQKIANFLAQKNICWIAMEYPNRDFSEPIKSVLRLNSELIFSLDNKKNFAEALKSKSFQDIFTDNFAKDFGHATRFGNSLIAENVFKLIQDLKIQHKCKL